MSFLDGIEKQLFQVTDTRFYVPVVTLSTESNAKLLQQLKSRFSE